MTLLNSKTNQKMHKTRDQKVISEKLLSTGFVDSMGKTRPLLIAGFSSFVHDLDIVLF